MRERINRLAKGILDSEIPALVLMPSEVEETIQPGITAKREIYITSENNIHIKGLMYSSDSRVHILNSAFGGVRNHLNYEVNTKYLNNGDCIKGSFYLVTNGGEKEIPYSFRVEIGTSGQQLSSLKTPKDFTELAKQDMDTALRLFEYKDFLEVPFMQDMHIRSVYSGLKGRGNRQNMLEEFLVAVKAKRPVELIIPTGNRNFENPLEPVEDTVRLVKHGWGHVQIDVKADGDFICLSKKTITDSDFKEDVFEYRFVIDPKRLHQGRNFGALVLSTMKETYNIKIEAMGDETIDISAGDFSGFKSGYHRYLELRLEYESETYENALLQNQMLKELELMQYSLGRLDMLLLLQAELYIMSDRKEQACLLLDECRDHILASRQDKKEMYCFYQYLNLKIKPDENQRESLVRLINKYIADNQVHYYLTFLLILLDKNLKENPGTLLNQMKTLYQSGCSSPFLYTEVCKIWEHEPGMLYCMESFELHALYFGAAKDMIGRNLALKIAGYAVVAKRYHHLFYRLLINLYQKYEDTEILSAICCMLIKGDCKKPRFFPWYEKGLKAGISLTRLYEYLLYSLPEDYDELLPKEVLLYFSYDNQLDDASKAVLYTNLLNYMSREDELFKNYERDIEKYAMKQLFSSRINKELAVIYEHMIYADIIDVPVAKVLPAILRSNRLTCENSNMKYVVISHEELMEEDAFSLKDGVAYVPLFSDHNVILFQDGYGNRYANIEFQLDPVIDRAELEERCFVIYPAHPKLLLEECRRVLELDELSEAQTELLEKALKELKLNPLFQKRILSKIIEFYKKQTVSEEEVSGKGVSYLLGLNYSGVSKEERQGIVETLIQNNFMKEAYELIKDYGIGDISIKRLLKLCTKMIMQKLFDQDAALLNMAYKLFESDCHDSIVLDYLCEHFNGNSEQMYHILLQAVREHVETYDMEERLAAQMMFSGETSRLDKVFDLYASRKKTTESILKAYFTIKSVEYFIENKPSPEKMFTYLEGAVNSAMEKDKVPSIYLLALSKFYSTLSNLSGEQTALCQSVISVLLREDMIFPYFKELGHHIYMPGDIMDKGMIEYHGRKESKPELLIRILPDEEDFHEEEMRRIYQGIYVKQKILFEGELMEYQIYDSNEADKVLVSEGLVEGGSDSVKEQESRFACLNQMGLCLNLKEEDGLKRKMKEYLVKTAAVEELFPSM